MGMRGAVVGPDLAAVSVRPVRDAAERAEWDWLMFVHRCLGSRCLFGVGIRHVAV